ncbi:MAG: zinc-ribbon domain-containing protein [Armatimonadetes bacterium]|nr:zinc-ribbon domain-containing protein [Armatimonadota bacterium]
MLIRCPTCQNKLSDSAPSCPHCGEPMGRTQRDEGLRQAAQNAQDQQSGERFCLGCVAVFFGLIVLAMIIGSFTK